jgi:hypothetical protein
MKKTLLFMTALFGLFSANSFGQSLTTDPVPSIQVGDVANISFTYTSTTSCAVYAELRIANIDGSSVITQDYSEGSNYIVGAFSTLLPASAIAATGTVTVTVPSNAVPSASLPVGKTYSWVYKLTQGVGDYNDVGSTFQYTGATISATTSVVDTLILDTPPSVINAGTDVLITVKYTCPAARLIKFGISIYDANGFVSDLVGTGVDNLPATTTTPVTLSQTLAIPVNATLSANLPSGQFYKVDTALFTPGYASYITGTSTNVTLNGSLGVGNFNKNSINIYPNPATYQINISNITVVKSFEIFNANGKVILKSDKLISNSIDISNLSSGIYFLKLGSMETVKFIKI